jgi:hypothetical protein
MAIAVERPSPDPAALLTEGRIEAPDTTPAPSAYRVPYPPGNPWAAEEVLHAARQDTEAQRQHRRDQQRIWGYQREIEQHRLLHAVQQAELAHLRPLAQAHEACAPALEAVRVEIGRTRAELLDQQSAAADAIGALDDALTRLKRLHQQCLAALDRGGEEAQHAWWMLERFREAGGPLAAKAAS